MTELGPHSILKIEFINFKMYNDICESACLGGVFESE